MSTTYWEFLLHSFDWKEWELHKCASVLLCKSFLVRLSQFGLDMYNAHCQLLTSHTSSEVWVTQDFEANRLRSWCLKVALPLVSHEQNCFSFKDQRTQCGNFVLLIKCHPFISSTKVSSLIVPVRAFWQGLVILEDVVKRDLMKFQCSVARHYVMKSCRLRLLASCSIFDTLEGSLDYWGGLCVLQE